MTEVTLYGYETINTELFVWSPYDYRKYFAYAAAHGANTNGTNYKLEFPAAICKVKIQDQWEKVIENVLASVTKRPCIILPDNTEFELEVTEFAHVKVPSTDEEARAICSTLLDQAPYKKV